MKNRVVTVIAVLVVCLMIQPVYGATTAISNDVKIILDGTQVVFSESDGAPFIDGANRTQMPFRIILEGIGAQVSWDQTTSVASAVKGDIKIDVPLGASYIIRNGEQINIDTKSIIVKDRIYLPLRAVIEAFNGTVSWDQTLRQVVIKTKQVSTISRLPVVYDLRTFQRLSSVKDQHEIGACWAFATLGALESSLLPQSIYDFSEDHMSLTHGYNLTQDEGGDFQISLAYLARWSGPVYEIQDPYGDSLTDYSLKAAVHVQEAVILPEKDYSAIKRAVMTHGGVQTSIHIRDIYEQELGDAYNVETNSFNYTGKVVPNHDVVIVGWDNTYSKDNFTTPPERDGAFICKNSYGDYFGEDGYFYVSYEDSWVGSESIVYTRIESNENYDNIYQSDWLGWVGRIGFGNDTAYFSNVYSTDNEESLEAVSFYSTDTDTSYKVYVVSDFTGVGAYENRKLVASGMLDYAGYYTIDIDEAVTVNGTYAVVVKIVTPDSLFPVAAEFYKDVPWLDIVDISDGQGYMSADGLVWESTESVLESNVALKAFTNELTVVKPIVEEEAIQKPDLGETDSLSESTAPLDPVLDDNGTVTPTDDVVDEVTNEVDDREEEDTESSGTE